MIQRANRRFSQFDTICRQADERLSHLVANLKNAAMPGRDVHDLQDLVKHVLPGSDDYKLTIARINNARRYLDSNEQVAAQYEIRQLIGSLRIRLLATGFTVASPGSIFDDEDEPSQNAIPAL